MIVKDYEETNVVKGDGSLITIKLDTPEVDISQVTWCKSPIPNPLSEEDRVPVDLDECRAPGLMHMQLFPNTHNLVQLPVSEPGTIYIDTTNLGGPDTRHQFNIIVTTASGVILCVRFNPLQTAKHAEVSSSPSSEHDATPSSSSSSSLETNPPKEEVTEQVSIQQNPVWMPPFIVFCAGLFVILLAAIVIRHRQKKISSPGYRDQPFEFEMISQRTDSDRELLTMLGKGADPTFLINK